MLIFQPFNSPDILLVSRKFTRRVVGIQQEAVEMYCDEEENRT